MPTTAKTKAKTSKTTTPRKAAAAKTPAAPVTPPPPSYAEILFDLEPNPYHPPVAPYLWIDYPRETEVLSGDEYVIRCGVGGAEHVELSINQGDWLPCRFASGYWWYDWSGIPQGDHTLVLRMRTGDGRWYRTPVRHCYRQG